VIEFISSTGKATGKEVRRIHVDGCLYNKRLNVKTEGSKRLAYTGLLTGRTYSTPSNGSSGRGGGTRLGQTRKKPKDLSACDREERGRGKVGGVYARVSQQRLFIIELGGACQQAPCAKTRRAERPRPPLGEYHRR
jgi:hypothetical protein